MWDAILTDGHWRGEVWNRRKGGEVYPEWLTVSSVRDQAGRLSHFVAVFSDISAMKCTQAELERLAHHDPLTDLPNRLLFNARLVHALERARREGQQVAVLYLDLDRFKQVNDTLGHPAGDQLLRQAAERLAGVLRECDTVARIGGDEFAVILEGVKGDDDCALVAVKLGQALARPFPIEGQPIFIGASTGIARFPEDGETITALLQNADAAMYRAKAAGRGTFRWHWCAGAIRAAASFRHATSSPWPRRPARSCPSATGSCALPVPRPGPGPISAHDDRVIARAVIALGHHLGFAIVAEGAETDEQAALLRAEGCEQAQGRSFRLPGPASQLRDSGALGRGDAVADVGTEAAGDQAPGVVSGDPIR